MQLSLLAFAGLAVAAPSFFVDNKCNFPLYLQYKNAQQTTGAIRLDANKTTAYSTVIGGTQQGQNSVTISRQPTLGSPLQALWSVGNNPSLTYYDLSTIYGDPLKAEGFQLLAGKASNGFSVVCKPRQNGDCPNTYSPSNPSGNNAVFAQGTNANLILQFCTSTGQP